MPELPEVETTRRGIAPHIEGRRILGVTVREPRLRWPVPIAALDALAGTTVTAVDRRAKYLLLRTARGTLIMHLGMSGSLRIVAPDTPAAVHDHVDIRFGGNTCLRLRDPRRFGSVHWFDADGPLPALLEGLGPEPLDPAFDGDHLYECSRGRRRSVKDFIMDGRIVVGVGNIYAAEALFAAGIHPVRAAGRVGRVRYRALAQAIKRILGEAIEHGGTTLRDFTSASGAPGYFRISLAVYGRGGAPCRRCGTTLRTRRLGQRATVYCPRCQT